MWRIRRSNTKNKTSAIIHLFQCLTIACLRMFLNVECLKKTPNRREKVHRSIVLYKVLKRIISKNKQTKKFTNISKEMNNYKDQNSLLNIK